MLILSGKIGPKVRADRFRFLGMPNFLFRFAANRRKTIQPERHR